MKQIVTIVKLHGQAGKDIIEYFERCRSGKAPASSVGAMATLLEKSPPVLPCIFFMQYIDMWSMFDTYEKVMPQGNTIDIDSVMIGWMPLVGDVRQTLKHLSSPFHKPMTQEETWLVHSLKAGVTAWSTLLDESVVVLVRRLVGGTVTDEEVLEMGRSCPYGAPCADNL